MATHKVLLIDDDSFFLEKILHPTVNTLLHNLLDTDDHHLIEAKLAYGGKEGWDLYQKFEPDIVFTDYHMPEMNGKQLAENISAYKHQPKAIFLISSDTDAQIKNMTKYIDKKDVMNIFVQANKKVRN